MADFSLRDAWWLQPKGPDNPLPALELGVRMSQYKSSMLLKERELANDIARTEILRREQEAKQRIQTMLAAGNAEMATAISQVTDWTDEEQVSRVWEAGARNPMTVGGKAWLGAQHMYESARTAKRLEEDSRRRASAGVPEAVTMGFDENGNPITENFVRFGNRVFRSTQHQTFTDPKSGKRFVKSGTGAIHVLDSGSDVAVQTNPDTGEEFVEAIPILDPNGKQVGLGYRGAKGNIIRLPQEQGEKLSQADKAKYDNELKALNDEMEAKLKVLSPTSDEANLIRKTYNLKRRDLHLKTFGTEAPSPKPAAPAEMQGPPFRPNAPPVQRSGLQTNEPPVVAPQPIAPENNPRAAEIRESYRRGLITKEQAAQQLRELGFK